MPLYLAFQLSFPSEPRSRKIWGDPSLVSSLASCSVVGFHGLGKMSPGCLTLPCPTSRNCGRIYTEEDFVSYLCRQLFLE